MQPKKGGVPTNGTRAGGESSAKAVTPVATQVPKGATPSTKRRQDLKAKAAKRAGKDDAALLGGADYVTLLLGDGGEAN